MHPKKLLIIIAILLISLCAQFILEAAPINPITQQKRAQAENYLSLADKSTPPKTYHYELLAADLYIQIGALQKAEALLAALSHDRLPTPLKHLKESLEDSLALKLSNDTLPPPPAGKSRTGSHIALFLPLKGPHAQPAEAIKAGFLANHPENALPIKIYDTSRSPDICALYYEAVQSGAHFIVGPLIKEEVYNLSKLTQSSLPIPILALNTHPDIHIKTPKPFFQFALSPEDEAKNLANKAFDNGHRNASIIVPENEWGKRILNAFSKQWQNLGGKLITTALINQKQDAQASIRKLLEINSEYDPKKQKHTKMWALRNQNIDMIALIAPPEQARQLRPLLDFYGAQDLKTYSTSSIYEGKPNSQQDRDLNAIIFCDMPFILMNQASPVPNGLARLYAMGLDAYQLMSRLSILKQSANAQYHGATGLLSIGDNHKIERELSWAQIKNGEPNPL